MLAKDTLSVQCNSANIETEKLRVGHNVPREVSTEHVFIHGLNTSDLTTPNQKGSGKLTYSIDPTTYHRYRL